MRRDSIHRETPDTFSIYLAFLAHSLLIRCGWRSSSICIEETWIGSWSCSVAVGVQFSSDKRLTLRLSATSLRQFPCGWSDVASTRGWALVARTGFPHLRADALRIVSCFDLWACAPAVWGRVRKKSLAHVIIHHMGWSSIAEATGFESLPDFKRGIAHYLEW